METAETLLKVFISLFIVTVPFASLPPFLKLTKRMHWKDQAHAADKAALVSAAVLIVCTILGPWMLEAIGVGLGSFRIAGGVMLFLIALQFVLGLSFTKEEHEKIDVALVLIAVPLITGPGAITTAVLFSTTPGIGIILVLAGISLASVANWLVLRFAQQIHNFIGTQGEEILTRLMGLLLGSIAVEFIRKGWIGV